MTAKRSLLKDVPPPLLHDLVNGRWLPVVGAGMSRNAYIPGSRAKIPAWEGLGEALADELPAAYRAGSPIEVISAYEHAYGRAKMVERVMRALHVSKAQPGPVHDAFCRVPFEAVVTTNVDRVLEAAYTNSHGAVLSIVDEQQLRLRNPYDSPVVVKFHGDLHHPSSLVLTEHDYDSFAISRPLLITWLAHQLITKTGVFLGYSLEDGDFRQILAMLRSRLGNAAPDLYVIAVNPDPVTTDRFLRRGVKVVPLPKTSRGYDVLGDFFAELGEYWTQHSEELLTGTTATVRALLRARQRADRAVLFIVPDESLSLYDEFVFPRLSDEGFVPVTRQEVAHPSGYRLAVFDALLRVAGSVVVQTDRRDDPHLLQARAAVGRDRVIVVRHAVVVGSEHFADATVPPSPEEWEAYAELLLQLLRRDDIAKPARFREQGLSEVSARDALLLRLVELEGRIRNAAGQSPVADIKQRRSGFLDVLQFGRQVFDLPLRDEDLRFLVVTRNRLVHGDGPVSHSAVARARDLVERLLGRLPNIE